MKVIRKFDGALVDVDYASRGRYEDVNAHMIYQASDLDFNLPEEKESMKLSDVKEQIDKWFNSHTPEEVLQKMIEYGMTDSKESAVIEGWAVKDGDGDLLISADKPTKETVDDGTLAGHTEWVAYGGFLRIENSNLFPSLTWESEPMRCKITITPIK